MKHFTVIHTRLGGVEKWKTDRKYKYVKDSKIPDTPTDWVMGENYLSGILTTDFTEPVIYRYAFSEQKGWLWKKLLHHYIENYNFIQND